jgi:hypothetical protein
VAAWLLFLAAAVPARSSVRTDRFQIDGDWCFLKRSEGAATDRAVVILHGNGEVVGEGGSSWESRRDETQLMEALAEAGFLVAQANARAVPGNGMWANAASQRAVLALMDHLRQVEHVRHFDALAISAGNLTLLNLLLHGKAFEHAVMLAPVTSLGSLYRCPAGVNRVQQISQAYRFTPSSGCPGDPEHDEAFRRASSGNDPAMSGAFTPEQVRRLRATRWIAVYEERDPKVPPQENILQWQKRLSGEGIEMKTHVIRGAATHTGPELISESQSELLVFLK